MKKISVVVPCYNVAMYLDKCMYYLLHQTIGIENMEIILVNDASTDDGETWELITEYERKFPDTIIAVSLEQNMRQGGARNVGITYASGAYLIFCDADDWLLKETLEHCYCVAEEYDADIVEFLIQNVYDRDAEVLLECGTQSRLIVLDTEEKRKEYLLASTEQLSLGSQKKFYKMSIIREHQASFAEHLIIEEPSFTVPLRLYEKRHYFLDERLYVCFLSLGSTMRGNWGERRWDSLKVWLHLMGDLEHRGLLQKYYAELEYLFFSRGYGLSMRMVMQKGYILSEEEFKFLTNIILEIFPNVRENQYIKSKNNVGTWENLLLTLLDIEFTDESVRIANELLSQYL